MEPYLCLITAEHTHNRESPLPFGAWDDPTLVLENPFTLTESLLAMRKKGAK